MKSIVICVLLMGLSATQDNSSRTDAYQIYSQIMPDPSLNSYERYAISATTMRSPIGPRDGSYFKCFASPASDSNRWNEVLDDFNARKDKPATLERALKISKPYFFITPEDEKAFMSVRFRSLLETIPVFQQAGTPAPATSPSPAQTTPDPRFQGFNSIFSLHDVYFSKDRTLALTGITISCGPLCGSQEWMKYEKHPDGSWVLLDRGCISLF